jgi:hypothetical protein
MKTTAVKNPAHCSGSLMATVSLTVTCFAQSQGQEPQPMGTTQISASEPGSEAAQSGESNPVLSVGNSQREADIDRKTLRLGCKVSAISKFNRRDPRDDANRSHTAMHGHARG